MTDQDDGLSAERQRRLEAHLADGRGSRSYLRPSTIVVLVVFATGAMLGAFVTGFWIPAPDSWWEPLSVRVGWQLGGALLLAVAITLEMLSLREAFTYWRATLCGLLAAAVLGSLLCVNPLLDLMAGPLVATGRLTLTVEDLHRRHRTVATFVMRTREAEEVESEITGPNKGEIVAQLQACDDRAPVTIIFLRHLEYVLAVSCTPRFG